MAIQMVSFHCVLKNKLGRIISSTYNQNVLTAKQKNQINLNGLADALQDLRKGERREVHLRADEAYGFYNPDLVLVRRLDELSITEPLKLGEQIVYIIEGQRRNFRVTEISAISVTLDGNHPLAGQDLIFEIETTEAREATAEEIGDPGLQVESTLLH